MGKTFDYEGSYQELKEAAAQRQAPEMRFRKIKHASKGRPTIEGAGVHLKRAFGYYDPSLDPFLLLDDFHSSNPDDYAAGFPWHPHRGIETITYVLDGEVKHGDSLGNKGAIKAGEVQWMTAGSGIIHEEMPNARKSPLRGFQLWANLPASQKMMDPRYRDVKVSEIPAVKAGGATVKIISGTVGGVTGPVGDIVTEPEYLDVTVSRGRDFKHRVPRSHNVFAYVVEGEGYFDTDEEDLIGAEHVVVYEEGDAVRVKSGSELVRLLLISGKPIAEPVAWHGPIVMNTEEELRVAFEEYRNGTFIKFKPE